MRSVLSFSYEQCWASQLVGRFGLRVKFVAQRTKGTEMEDEVIVWGKSHETVDEALDFLGGYQHLTAFRLVERSPNGSMARLKVKVNAQTCPLYSALRLYSSTGENPVLERVNYDGSTTWELETAGSNKTEKVVELLGKKFQIREVRSRRRQRRSPMSKSAFLLKEAYERGYFDVPKDTSLRRVSREMGVPLSSLSVDLRRALKDVVDKATR